MSASAVRSFRACVLGALVAGLGGPPVAAAQANPAAPPPANSRLDAQLFYQLLIGEIELRSGEAGSAYQIVLDAARRTRDEQLFRRATEIALQARAGEQALAAVMAWRTTLPNSLEAHRYLVQLLVLLNRPAESIDPLRALIQLTPAAERVTLIQSLPRFFARAPDRTQVAEILTKALQPQLDFIAWRSIFTHTWMRVPTFVCLIAVYMHAWIGVRDILMDYVKPTILRLGLLVVVAVALLAYTAWTVQILWSL